MTHSLIAVKNPAPVMARMANLLNNFLAKREGGTLSGYALILVLIGVVAIVAVTAIGH